jgi:3-oxoacyl-[acyl-carrier-protein] synthase II
VLNAKFINTFSGINVQNPDPECQSWLDNLTDEVGKLTLPDFKQYIDPKKLRRMSKLMRMTLTCANCCVSDMKDLELKGIVVATGLGCLDDTRKFLVEFSQHEVASPTAFIHSTHNTIAGQLGLLLQSHAYNITHANTGACFENALLDAFIEDIGQNEWILVGGVDEQIDWLENLRIQFADFESLNLGSGCTFLGMSTQKTEDSVRIVDVNSFIISEQMSAREHVRLFLEKNDIKADSLDLVLTNSNQPFTDLQDIEKQYYQNHCGSYFTNSTFGMEYAVQRIRSGDKMVLVINHHEERQIGLTLLSDA